MNSMKEHLLIFKHKIVRMAILLWLLSLLVFSVISVLTLHHSLLQSIQAALHQNLAPLIEQAHISYLPHPKTETHIQSMINQQLQSNALSFQHVFIDNVDVSLTEFKEHTAAHNFDHAISITWADLLEQHRAKFSVSYQLDVFALCMFLFFASSLLTISFVSLQAFQSRRGKRVIHALKRKPFALTEAYRSAVYAGTLSFDLKTHSVLIDNTHITLSKTPFFYYLWYAQRRVDVIQDGWYINPAVDKADLVTAQTLINLMQTFGGHSRAINELKKHGLRARTLDQNRNKIKEELSAVFSEELAAMYLFESQRDRKSGRFAHRISLPKERIFI